ncbi:MAG: PAS domain S-box protein [Elusimicrobia bacterium]|nr:PAS domain S-box protein [Elusimicrobiota bacterium]
MKDSLLIVFIEDSKTDVKLVENNLKKAGMFFESVVIETKDRFIDFLASRAPDLILCDFKMPSFDAETALKIRNEKCPYTPFILVTGSLVDEAAVDFLKMGATDYILKDRIQRLIPAIKRAMKELEDEKELANAQKMLIEREKRYRELFENSPDLISILSDDGRFVVVNRAWETALGYSSKELSALSHMDILDNDSRDKYVGIFKRAAAGEKVTGIELVFTAKDGKKITVESILHPMIESMKVMAVQGIFRDITDKKDLESQLIHAMKMDAIGRLAGGIAHDFNNILGAIEGYSSLMLSNMSENDPNRSDIEEIKKAVDRGAALTRQLLAFSKKQNLQKKRANAEEIVTGLEKMLRRMLGEDIRLAIENEENLPDFEIDPGQIEQVIINLIINSRQAMPEGGTIVIKTKKVIIGMEHCKAKLCPSYDYPFIELSVRDTGLGMTKGVLERVFEPFFTTKEKGTGLGLSVSYGIVKQHNGWIEAESEPGKGSAFRLYIPALQGEEANRQVISAAVAGEKKAEYGGRRILIIEDDKSLRNIASRSLKKSGCAVFEASSAGDAVSIFKKEKGNFDIIFSDVILTDAKGTAVVQEMLGINPDLKFVFTSGYAEEGRFDINSMLKKGFLFLQKPYSTETLLKTVGEIFLLKEGKPIELRKIE